MKITEHTSINESYQLTTDIEIIYKNYAYSDKVKIIASSQDLHI